jgi:ribonuclease T2
MAELTRHLRWGETMLRERVRRAAQGAAIAASFLFIFAVVALAQDRRQNAPGEFDFYVLALSWSPTYCERAKERAPSGRPDPQCSGRPFAFVVHGLWPQYEQGFPSYCRVPAPRLDRATISAALDLMPSPRLVFREWERHGTCSGLTPQAYFEAVRKARAAVKIPDEYLAPTEPRSVSPEEVAAAFMRANAGLSRQNFAVVCDATRLTEVRVCMSRDFAFRDCADVVRRACRRDKIAMPVPQVETNGTK